MINSVEMTNWRAHEHQTFYFKPGVTFLMGLNGAGKTSILEAICYALIGEPTTVTDRKKLLRDPEQIATVRLTFTVDGKRYEIERSQSSQRAESAYLAGEDDRGKWRTLSTSHRSVTSRVEKLLGVSSTFLERIVYMSEGDVFRFLSRPPGQALDLQIRQVLGLTQLDEFLQALKTANKQIRDQIRDLQDALDEYETLSTVTAENPEVWQAKVEQQHRDRLADLRFVEEKLGRHRQEHAALTRLKPLLIKAIPLLEEDEETWTVAQTTAITSLFEQLESDWEDLKVAEEKYDNLLASWNSEETVSNEIVRLVAPLMEHTETVPCPVCQKPFTPTEREGVVDDIRGTLGRLAGERHAIREQKTEAQLRRRRRQAQVESLRPLIHLLTHAAPEAVNVADNLLRIRDAIQAQDNSFQDEEAGLKEAAALLEHEIGRLRQENVDLLAIQGRLENMGYDTPDAAREGLIALETRHLSLRAAEQAASEILTARRNVDMDTIYGQVATVWTAFAGKGDWQVELDSRGIPILHDGMNRELDLSQFSGGEKTGLLVILHTLIAQHFSETDFLLIDEPLEHLDPVNRRSLVQFLVNAYRRGSFRQAIIATFEESLVRKYMSDDDVHVIHLQ